MRILFLLLVSCCHLIFCEEMSPRCSPWVTIEEELKGKDSHINCIKNENCTGMNCSGNSNGYEVHGGILINPCENPPSIEVLVDIPSLYVNNWKRKFYHGDSFALSSNLGGELEIQKEKNKIILGLSLHLIYGKNDTHSLFPLLHFPVKFPVFQNVVFSVPECSSFENYISRIMSERISVTPLPSTKSPVLTSRGLIADQGNCSITNSSCSENELCKQINKSQPNGICVCISNYMRDDSGNCIYSPTTDATTKSPGSHTEPKHKETSNVSLLLTAILVPLTVILFIVGIVYATIRFRICQHLRRRLRVQVYEQVLLGQDDENEDESLNPVA